MRTSRKLPDRHQHLRAARLRSLNRIAEVRDTKGQRDRLAAFAAQSRQRALRVEVCRTLRVDRNPTVLTQLSEVPVKGVVVERLGGSRVSTGNLEINHGTRHVTSDAIGQCTPAT